MLILCIDQRLDVGCGLLLLFQPLPCRVGAQIETFLQTLFTCGELLGLLLSSSRRTRAATFLSACGGTLAALDTCRSLLRPGRLTLLKVLLLATLAAREALIDIALDILSQRRTISGAQCLDFFPRLCA